MHSESDFIRAIVSRPSDDAPRLLYCDWLEDRNYPGDAERAADIRLGIDGKRADDERGYYRHVPRDDRWPTFLANYSRGFVSRIFLHAIHVESDNASRLLGTIFRNHPIEHVAIVDGREAFGLYSMPSDDTIFFGLLPSGRVVYRWGRMPYYICQHWPDPAGPFGEKCYPTEQAANIDLSTAIVSWGRSLAKLPALANIDHA